MRICSKCKEDKPKSVFYKNRAQPGGLNVWCKPCHQAYCAKNAHKKSAYAKDYYAANAETIKQQAKEHRKTNGKKIRAADKRKHRADPRLKMLKGARVRAKSKGIKFNIVINDIFVPVKCPLLRIPLAVGKNKHCAGSPTLDRKNPKLGYVRGNVWVISHRANSIKRDATLKELRTMVKNWNAK